MTNPDLLEIADQIATARDMVDLIQLAHGSPGGAPTSSTANQASKLLKEATDALRSFTMDGLLYPTPPAP